MKRALGLALLLLVLPACGRGDGAEGPASQAASSSSAADAAQGTGPDLDAVLARYDSPESMRAKIVADPRFKDFSCAPTSRPDSFGGRFIQCAKSGDGNIFLRLESYDSVEVGTKVDDGLTAAGWLVYPSSRAALASAGDPQLLRDAFDALGS